MGAEKVLNDRLLVITFVFKVLSAFAAAIIVSLIVLPTIQSIIVFFALQTLAVKGISMYLHLTKAEEEEYQLSFKNLFPAVQSFIIFWIIGTRYITPMKIIA